ncbi:MAG: hypothetical protein U0793_03170 [Gemmataceae bacterium]
MHRLIPALLCGLLLVGGGVHGGGKDKATAEKPRETAIYDVHASELAKEFEKSPADALKKYQAPKKGVGGALINMHGKVLDARGKTATFDTGSSIQITLAVDYISWPAEKGKRMTFDVTHAKVVDFSRNTIVLEAEQVVIGNLPDGDKKEPAKEKK